MLVLSFIITVMALMPICNVVDKFITYGKENELYISGYLHED